MDGDKKAMMVDYQVEIGKALARSLAVAGLIYAVGTESMKERVIKDSLIFGAGGGLISEMFLEKTFVEAFSDTKKTDMTKTMMM